MHSVQAPHQLEAIATAGGRPLDASACPDDDPYDWKFECAGHAAMEAVLATLDVVVDESYPDQGDYAAYTVAVFRQRFRLSADDGRYPFLASRRLYRTDRRLSLADGTQGSDFYESAIPHADVFLSDLASVLVPSAAPGHTRRYLRNLATAEPPLVINASACTDPYAVCPGQRAPPAPPAALNFCEGGLCRITAPPSAPPAPPAPPWATPRAAAAPAAAPSTARSSPSAVPATAAVLVPVCLLSLGGAFVARRVRRRGARLGALLTSDGARSTHAPAPEYVAPAGLALGGPSGPAGPADAALASEAPCAEPRPPASRGGSVDGRAPPVPTVPGSA